MKIMRIHLLSTFVIIALAMSTTGCADNPEEKAKDHGQEIWFEETLHDYGEIEEDSDGTWSFVFKNLGKEAIVINRVRSTCGCTVPDWPREPIEAGASGEITVKYNTATTGTFLKSVIVYSSAANSPVKLQIKGKVFAKTSEEG
jgi:hypothetical protein